MLRLSSLASAVALLVPAAPASAQVWDKPAAPGITFRMERQANPQRSIYGLRIDPRVVRAESALAGKTVYEAGPANGRQVVSAMVREQDAMGGVNGDFFQWGADPGGDPLGLMVRGGELLSHPGTGDRALAAGWGGDGTLALGAATWQAQFSVNGGPQQTVHSLNARADGGQITLHTDSAGYAYATAETAVARIRAGAYRLGPDSTLSGTVTQVIPLPLKERARIAPGEFLLTGAGKVVGAIRSLKPGDAVQVKVKVKGFDWKKVGEVMGGGPLLLRDGKSALPSNPGDDPRHPRTAMGRTSDGSLWFVVIDGRQTMSVGASLAETAQILQKWGCMDAINLDGGGSTTLNFLGASLNRPSGGIERSVANGVLLYGDRPTVATPQKITITAPTGPLQIGTPVRVEALNNGVRVEATRTLFAAQGAGWIDQEGMLHPVGAGTIRVIALVDGAVGRLTLKVAPAPAPATPVLK